FKLPSDVCPRKPFLDICASQVRYALVQLGIFQQLQNSTGKVRGLIGCKEVLTVCNMESLNSNASRNDRPAECHCLIGFYAGATSDSDRDYKNMARSNVGTNILYITGKLNVL